MAGVYYRSPDQGEAVHEAFLIQLQETVLTGSYLDGGFQTPRCLLEMQYSRLQAIPEAHRVCWEQLTHPTIRQINQKMSVTGPTDS